MKKGVPSSRGSDVKRSTSNKSGHIPGKLLLVSAQILSSFFYDDPSSSFILFLRNDIHFSGSKKGSFIALTPILLG